ncbi:MAG: LytR C-terminal domain-containing protein [Patescibacteria group bacterium]|nr:LytR C-terminal domain-containing protein [Patescibacteria group bacterium]
MNSSKKKFPKWRREQKKMASQKKKSQVYLGLIFIFLICFFVLFNYLWRGVCQSVWNGKSRIGIVMIEDEELNLKVLLPEQKKSALFKVPLNTISEVPFGFGKYKLGSIYSLGKLEREGGRLLMKTIQDNFGVFISAYKVEGESNLTWWDVLRITWYELITVDKRKEINLINQQVLEDDILADGSKVFKIKLLLLDELLNHELFDEKLLTEELEIAVLNASGGEGEAFSVSRLIRNIGGDVVVVSNLDLIQKSMIKVKNKDDLKSYTVKVLVDILNIDKVEFIENNEFRADVMVIIGKDYLSLR